jgi:O-acetylhomoserine (thiol)-lyase
MLAFSNLMNAGDNFVALNKLYGGSVTQFSRQFKQFGWEVRFTEVDAYEEMEKAIDEKTKCVYCESICNPGGVIVDLDKVASIAHKHKIPLIVDNTTATPYLCRPFEHGADIIVHSLTKYMGGHGNAMGGAVVEKGDFDWGTAKFPLLSEACAAYHGMNFNETFGMNGPVADMFGTKGKSGLAFVIGCRTLGLRDMGMCLAPQNAFYINMGLETLHLRMKQHCSNAQTVAEFLEKHEKVEAVSYAGLASNPFNALAKKYCPKGASGLFTFRVKGGFEAAKLVVNSVKMISLVANLGDVRTLIAHPASMMHRQLSEEDQRKAGAAPEEIRMSIGIEEPEDIINDLEQALAKI